MIGLALLLGTAGILRDYRTLGRARNNERDEEEPDWKRPRELVKMWYSWRRWTISRYLSQARNLIGVRLFAHLPVLKIIAAFVIAVVAYRTTEKSSTVAAATVLYASILTFRELGDYASLRLSTDNKIRWSENDRIDDLQASIKIDNVGPTDARQIELSARCIDPIRGASTDLIHLTHDGDKLDPDNFKLDRGLSQIFRVNASGNENNSSGYQLEMFDHAGIHPWLVIDADSPDSFMTSTLHVPYPQEESITREDFSMALQFILGGIDNRKSKVERLTNK